MSEDRTVPPDPVTELRYALAEADAEDTSTDLRARVLGAAAASRAPMTPADPPAHISGVEVFRRTIASLDGLLTGLDAAEWSVPALRDLDVQGLVGHLVGVEESFDRSLRGEPDGGDHVTTTQPAAVRQGGRDATATHREWFDCATRTLAAVSDLDPTTPVGFYGVTLPLDQMLVVRAFEMWTHDEDVRRATGRALHGPEPESLARMVALVATLLPVGIARAGRVRPETTVRLVLTGAGGGTWDLSLDGTPVIGRAASRIVVDATTFCRVVGNRADLAGVDPVVSGDHATATDVFVGAAALALD